MKAKGRIGLVNENNVWSHSVTITVKEFTDEKQARSILNKLRGEADAQDYQQKSYFKETFGTKGRFTVSLSVQELEAEEEAKALLRDLLRIAVGQLQLKTGA